MVCKKEAHSLLTPLNSTAWTVSGTGQALTFDSDVLYLDNCGRWHLARAAIEVGYSCGPPIDLLPAFGGSHVFDILTSAGRHVV